MAAPAKPSWSGPARSPGRRYDAYRETGLAERAGVPRSHRKQHRGAWRSADRARLRRDRPAGGAHRRRAGAHRWASCGCSRRWCARAAGSTRGSTRRCRTARRCRAPTCGCATSRWGRSRCSAPATFPLAFSVAGGDTASALAAGCPVVVKAHPAHPGTSELVGRAVQAAVAACGMPEGMFSLLFGEGNWLGGALVADPRIKAVGFTGSRAGGLALVRIAAGRREPIPVFAEMSSINPVILLPAALAARAAAIADGFVASLTMGAGQFCTNPGLIAGARRRRRWTASWPPRRPRWAAARPRPCCIPASSRPTRLACVGWRATAGCSPVARGLSAAGANSGESALFETRAVELPGRSDAEGGDLRRLVAGGALPRPGRDRLDGRARWKGSSP